MSLKPVELQIAVPRTTEATKVQHELQHRSALDQQQLAGQNVKLVQEAAQRSGEVDESADAALRNDGSRGGHADREASSRKKQPKEELREAEHPYKGHRIDFSL